MTPDEYAKSLRVVPKDETLVSTADVAKFLYRRTGLPNPVLDVYVQPTRTHAIVTGQNAKGDEFQIDCFVLLDYDAAFSTLQGCLNTFARPIDDVFGPAKDARVDKQHGKLLLESSHMMLWVCHNIFLCSQVTPVVDEELSRSDTSAEEDRKALVAQKGLREFIERGIRKVAGPRLAEIDKPLPRVSVHRAFEVQVSVDTDHYHQVHCNEGMMHLGSKKREKTDSKGPGHVYQFVAYETGMTDISFCFAQSDSLYPFHLTHAFEVHPGPIGGE